MTCYMSSNTKCYISFNIRGNSKPSIFCFIFNTKKLCDKCIIANSNHTHQSKEHCHHLLGVAAALRGYKQQTAVAPSLCPLSWGLASVGSAFEIVLLGGASRNMKRIKEGMQCLRYIAAGRGRGGNFLLLKLTQPKSGEDRNQGGTKQK